MSQPLSSTSSSASPASLSAHQRAHNNWVHLARMARERVHFFPDKIARIYDQTREGLARYISSPRIPRGEKLFFVYTISWNSTAVGMYINNRGPMNFGHHAYTDYVTVQNGEGRNALVITEYELKRDEATPPLVNKWIVDTSVTKRLGYHRCSKGHLHRVRMHFANLDRSAASV